MTKKNVLMLMLLFISIVGVGQSNFKWDIVIDSLPETKSELYSKTKLFVGEKWRSAQHVIQVDDKEGGIILVKGLSIQSLFYQFLDHRWTYSYSIKFMFKDNKCRIVVDDVHCSESMNGLSTWPKMPVSDTYPEKSGLKITGVNESRYFELMGSLKGELQSIVDSFKLYVKQPVVEENADW